MKRRAMTPLQWGDPRCKNMTAAIICRKSTATEGKSKSRDEQLELGHIDAKRYGFGRVLEFIEPEGCKGEWYWRDKDGRFQPPYREELGRMIEQIEAGEIQAVIAYKLNRLVRDNGVEDALGKLFQRCGVHLILGGRDVAIDTAKGKCETASEAARAREWRDQISEDISRDHDYKFDRLMFTRNPSCYGFRSQGRGTQAIHFIYEELENVNKIFQWFVGWGGTKELGPYQIARRCMREGLILAVGAKGHTARNPKLVMSSQITSILENPMYIGKWQHRGERKDFPKLLVPPQHAKGESETAIPIEIWDRAQAKLGARPRCGRKAGSSDRLLAGLVVCGACGRPCHLNSKRRADGKQTLRWICPHRTEPLRSCFGDSYASVIAEELDSWATDYLAPMMSLELEDIIQERLDSPFRNELREVERLLEENRLKATVKLKAAMDILDEQQLGDIAENLRGERLTLERRSSELRRFVADETGALGGGDPSELLSIERQTLKNALHRYVRWISLSKEGVIAHTTTNSYVPGRYKERDLTIYSQSNNVRTIEPPDIEAACECLYWLSDKEAFVDGRRYALGPSGEGATNEQLLPDAWNLYE